MYVPILCFLVSMYICMFCTDLCTCVFVPKTCSVCVYLHVYVLMNVFTCLCMYIFILTLMNSSAQVYVRMYVCINALMDIISLV